MALSFSRPDPASPASIADASFSTARRGFDQNEVRDVLREVAAELGRLIERERFLERELRTIRETTVDRSIALDEEAATRLLGEETIRVLQTARESASQIKTRAEESATRIIREATEEASRLRTEADLEAARVRSDASADAEAELSLAKQQGREMVDEARAYRERVLSELGRRREAARQQIDQLVAGRDRLLQVFERARLVAVDVTNDLGELVEPDEYVNLAPDTGPVPLMVPARPADDAVEDVEDVEDVEEVEVEDDVASEVEAEPEPEPETETDDSTNVVALFRSEPVDDDGSSESGESGVGGLFARLRAETSSDAEPTDQVIEDAVGETIFEARDAALVPLITSAARKLKRVLADEQNDALDTLRGRAAVTDLDALVPAVAAHVDRFTDAIVDELRDAIRVGAALHDADRADEIAAGEVLVPVRTLVSDGLVLPLRNRLGRAVADGSGDNDDIVRRVRAVYREWKTKHIDDQLDDIVRLAHGVGSAAAIEAGTPACWMIDPAGPACPDAEDNALAGAIPAGEAYPTGHVIAPAHPGCRCLIAPPAN